MSDAKSPIMKYFKWSHLSPDLQFMLQGICDAAVYLDRNLPHSAEKSEGLRKLLEAKDCFKRAAQDLQENRLEEQFDSREGISRRADIGKLNEEKEKSDFIYDRTAKH